jgi:hypothetical protein
MPVFLIVLSVVLFLVGGCNVIGALTDRNIAAATGSALFAFIFLAGATLCFVFGIRGLGRSPSGPPERVRKCPFCAELVKAEARVCRYCQHELTPLPVTTCGVCSRPTNLHQGWCSLAQQPEGEPSDAVEAMAAAAPHASGCDCDDCKRAALERRESNRLMLILIGVPIAALAALIILAATRSLPPKTEESNRSTSGNAGTIQQAIETASDICERRFLPPPVRGGIEQERRMALYKQCMDELSRMIPTR